MKAISALVLLVSSVAQTTGSGGILTLDGTHFTTLAGCYAAIPSTGGVCVVPPNYTESGFTLAMDKNYAGFDFMGPAALTGSITITAARGAFIRCNAAFGSFFAVNGTEGCSLKYTGAGTALLVGATGADTTGVEISNFGVSLINAGPAAVGIDLIRTQGYNLQNVQVAGSGIAGITQVGVKLDGTNNYTGFGTIINFRGNGLQTCLLLTGSQSNAGNANSILNGTCNSGVNSPIGIDFEAGSQGNTVTGFDAEAMTTAYNFGGTAQSNRLDVRGEGNITDFSFAAGTLKNFSIFMGNTPVTLNSGTNNVVIDPGTFHSGLLTLGCHGRAGLGPIFLGHDSCGSASVAALYPVPAAAWTNLRCAARTGGRGPTDAAITVKRNGLNQTVHCTLGTRVSCNDTTHSFITAAGDTLGIQVVTEPGTTLVGVFCSLEKQ